MFAWSLRAKELAHCESDGRKISHLKGILADLGMTGRMSMEQAKTIREKRELQQEIGEDVTVQHMRPRDKC